MQWRSFAILLTLALAVLLFAKHKPPPVERAFVNNIFDLTYTINSNIPSWDPAEQFRATALASYEKDGYYARHLSFPEHFGTHMDAPAHFAPGAWTVEQIPPERLVRPLVIIDIAKKARQSSDYALTIDDIADWEAANGHIPTGAIVAIRSAWGERWSTPAQFLNADAKGTMHFPGFSLAAAQFLVEARAAVALGTDTLSVDPGAETSFPVHKYAAAKGVYSLEAMANLEITPEKGLTVVVAPAKISGGSGAPVRLFAMRE